jgi:hypothetical protein
MFLSVSATLSQYMLYLLYKFSIEHGHRGKFVDFLKGTCMGLHDYRPSSTETILNLTSIDKLTL